MKFREKSGENHKTPNNSKTSGKSHAISEILSLCYTTSMSEPNISIDAIGRDIVNHIVKTRTVWFRFNIMTEF